MSSKPNHLPFMTRFCLVLALLGALVGFFVRGWTGAFGVGAGILLACGSFVVSAAALTYVETVNRSLLLPLGLLTYFFKLVFFVVILTALSGTAGMIPTAIGLAAGVLGWTIGYAWWLWHAKIPYVEL